MPLWKVEVYENKEDATPSRVGYLNAATEDAAVQAAMKPMGEANRADLNVVALVVSTLPPLEVLWVQTKPKGP